MNVQSPSPLLSPLPPSYYPASSFSLDFDLPNDSKLLLATLKDDEAYSQIKLNPKASFLPYRVPLIDLIRTWCKKFSFSDRTYFLSIHYMDDVMSNLAFPKTRIHLAALCCLLLAGIFFCIIALIAKFSEPKQQVPLLEELQEVSPTKYEIKEIRNCELLILIELKFALKSVTVYDFALTVSSLCGGVDKHEELFNIINTAYTGYYISFYYENPR